MKFLVFIFWCIVFFYVLGLVSKLILRRYVDRRMKEFSRQQGAAGQQRSAGGRARNTKPEGQVTVERIERVEKHVNRDVGEYVEYEEVEEIKEETGEEK